MSKKSDDSDGEQIFYEIPTRKVSDNRPTYPANKNNQNTRQPKFLQPFGSAKKQQEVQEINFADNIFYIHDGGRIKSDRSRRPDRRPKSIAQNKPKIDLTEMPAPRSHSRSKSQTKVRATSKKESFRISFKQEVLPPKNLGRFAEENRGSPLKHYLKEIDEQRLVHNPQNKIQVDDKGILKIFISQDESVG